MEIKIIRPKSEGLFKGFDSGRKCSGNQKQVLESVNTHENRKGVDDGEKINKICEIMSELNDLIGLHSVKKLVFEILAFIEIQKKRQVEKLVSEPLVLHMIFKGNPGTGKTTVARYLGNLFRQMNVLSKGHLVEAERADLVGEYIGHTAQKTRELLKKTYGGILFIDEAYSLARGGEKDFGKEAIDVMVKAMEDQKDNLILILAGYNHEMDEFLNTNPGLKSRFPIHIDFPDYTVSELSDIADLMLKRRQYSLSPSAQESLKKIIELKTGRGHEFSGNARLVRNLIEKAIRRQAVRLINKETVTREDLLIIEDSDIIEARIRCLANVNF